MDVTGYIPNVLKPEVTSLFLIALDGLFCSEQSSLLLNSFHCFQPSPPPLLVSSVAAGV